MNQKQLFLTLKKFVKNFVDYTIEDDCKIYTLKGTPLKASFSLQKKFDKTWRDIPIQENKIVFNNYMGSAYGCNGKYVTEELLRSPEKYHIVWVVRDVEKNRHLFPKEVELAEYLSPEAFRAYASAKIWVCNFQMVSYLNKGLQKKDGQIFIQLWHGSFGIKKIEGDCGILTQDKSWLYLARKSSSITDYWISNSSFETAVYRQAFWNVSRVLEYGHPRNDIFFADTAQTAEKVKKSLHLSPDTKLALYVPTFRDLKTETYEEPDARRLLNSLKSRFGGNWVFLKRLHPRMAAQGAVCGSDSLDVTAYPDIQELLAAADTVITDYSSCIFDFMLSGRPGFLYAPDSKDYERMRGLYYPLTDTPFPLAHDNEELCRRVREFEEEPYRTAVREFLRQKGSVEDGAASRRTAALIRSLTASHTLPEESL